MPSSPALASRCPSGENATPLTGPVQLRPRHLANSGSAATLSLATPSTLHKLETNEVYRVNVPGHSTAAHDPPPYEPPPPPRSPPGQTPTRARHAMRRLRTQQRVELHLDSEDQPIACRVEAVTRESDGADSS